MKRARILLADDHTLLLEAFTSLLEPKFEVVGTAADGRALLTAAQTLEPDVIVLDISMPELDGIEAGRRIKRLLPDVALIFLTVSEDLNLAAHAFRMGASAYLLKKSAASELYNAIEHALSGERYLTPFTEQALAQEFRDPASSETNELTPRQREVLTLLAEGCTMKEAANVLRVKTRTVAFHKYKMMKNLRIEKTAALIQYAVKHGFVQE